MQALNKGRFLFWVGLRDNLAGEPPACSDVDGPDAATANQVGLVPVPCFVSRFYFYEIRGKS